MIQKLIEHLLLHSKSKMFYKFGYFITFIMWMWDISVV